MNRANLTKPFWAASASLLLFVAGLLTSVILVEECHTEEECNFNDPDAKQCPEGLECCETGICCQITGDGYVAIDPHPLARPVPRPCAVGEAITPECVCLAPNHDRDAICTGPAPIPLACESPIVQTTLKRLHQACKDHGGIGSCPPDKIRAFVIDNKDTLLELARSQAPNSVSIHFTTGTPAPSEGPAWAAARQAELLARLRQHLALSQRKGFMLMMVINSNLGDEEVNIPIARERAAAMLSILARLSELLHISPLQGIVTTNVQISPTDFLATWGADPGNGFPERFIGPSKDVEDTMRRHLARHGRESRWLKHMINQSVILIPIPCDIDQLSGNTAMPAV